MGHCFSTFCPSESSDETRCREYAAACSKYPELNRFDTEAKKQVHNIFRTASKKAPGEGEGEAATEGEGDKTCEILLGLLKQATSSMLSTNMAAIEAIEQIVKASKSKVWGENPALTQLLKEYCDNSLAMLRLCSELKISIGTARSSQLLLKCALKLALGDPGTRSIDCEKVSELLNEFRSAGNPFGESFWDSFQRMHDSNKQLLQKLKTKMGEKKKKIKSPKMWSKICFIVFGALAATLGISAVVVAVIAAPASVVGALAASTALPITSVGGWIKSLLLSHVHKIQDEYNVFEKMEKHTEIHIIELASLQASSLGLEVRFKAMESTIGFIDRLGGDTRALQLVVEDLEKRRQEFVGDLDTLEECIKTCETRINCAIYVILDMIKRH